MLRAIFFCANDNFCYNGVKILIGRSCGVEVPEKIFRRHSTRLAAIFFRADFAGSLSRAVHLADVKLFGRNVGRNANSFGNVRGLAIEFEDCGRGHVNFVRARDNHRFAFTVAARHRNYRVADIFAAVHAKVSVLSRVPIDVRA